MERSTDYDATDQDTSAKPFPAFSAGRVLVTGYGGFLGAEIVRQLVARGNQVIGIGRGDYPDLAHLSIERHRGDIRDEASLRKAIDGVDAVIHTAAIAGIWGPWELYHSINTVGTQNVVDACRAAGVPILVHCSSPSVTFAGNDQSGIDEAAPYPATWLCHYPHTKALAEQAVLGAHQLGTLHTVALRPHLIWGAADPHLFPRLIARARQGRLRVVGDGRNLIDTVHVRNAAAAHIAALDALHAEYEGVVRDPSSATDVNLDAVGGRAYFITQGEPVNCWDWIREVLNIAGVPAPTRRIGFSTAWTLGHALESVYRWTGRKAEPPMTRFLAAQLAKDHYFDITAAQQRLRYRPQISMAQGLQELRDVWGERLAGNGSDA